MRTLISLTNTIALVFLLQASTLAHADDNSEAIKAMEDYLAFVDYGGATIFPDRYPPRIGNGSMSSMPATRPNTTRNTSPAR